MLIKLTDHFILQEFTDSATAKKHKVNNVPTLSAVRNLLLLCECVLEPLRKKCGPIHISSGYRTAELNGLVGGSATSQHMTGQAADIACPDRATANKYHAVLKKLDFDQLIWEEENGKIWLHVSYVSQAKNRHNKLIIQK